MAKARAGVARLNPRRRRKSRRVALATAALLTGITCASSGCGGSAGRAATTSTAGSAPASGAPAPPVAPSARPNIVFVLTDDLARNLVGFMPHVLAMQRSGATFSNYFVTDSLCCPSRSSIFTGLFPHDTHVFDNSPPEGGYITFHERHEERKTFALALQRRGYRTALMGKYLNGYRPAVDGVPPGWSQWDVAGNGYPEYGYRLNSNGRVRYYGYHVGDYLTSVLSAKGVDFIRSSAARHRPFLLEIATFAPHSPFTPAPRDGRSFPGLRAPRTLAFDAIGSNEPPWLSHFLPLQRRKIARIDRDFRRRAQAVQAVDRMIARIETVLKAEGLARNTYIVFSSDNGLHMGEHRLLTGKLTAFDTDIRVPLIVTGPGIAAGRTASELVENVDLCPTFERLAGAPVPAASDGRSLVPLLQGRSVHDWRREVLIEHHGRLFDRRDPDYPTVGAGNPPSYEAIRTAHSLYVEYGSGEREYYDLASDPFELRNLAGRLSPRMARRLHGALDRVERCHGASCRRAQG
jgi:N-acetylglucosamine-6-sulfatase